MIRAWNTRTNKWQYIPGHWLEHPIWGADFLADKPAEVEDRKVVKETNSKNSKKKEEV